MAQNGMRGRIEKLEQNIVRENDGKILAWGATVTDDELREVASSLPSDRPRNRHRLSAGGITDAELWQIVMPAIQAHRMASFNANRTT